MRVQNISNNYQKNCRKQSEPSFQAKVNFVKQCLDQNAIDGFYKVLATELNAFFVSNKMGIGVSVNRDFKPYAVASFSTDAARDEEVIPALKAFAETHGLDSFIEPGSSNDITEVREPVYKFIYEQTGKF